MRRASLALLVVAGCRFDPAGVTPGDDDGDDGDDVIAFDASIIDSAEAPDSAPPDSMPDPDADGDTIPDVSDNCPSIPNTDQHDEDDDDDGDVCDNCPHVANADQANTTENAPDGVGDACDPRPTEPDVIALFEPFSGEGAPPGWTAIGGTWTRSGDQVTQSTTTGIAVLYYSVGTTWKDMRVDTTLVVGTVPPGTGAADPASYRSVGMISFFLAGDIIGTGHECLVLDDANDLEQAWLFSARHNDDGQSASGQISAPLGAALAMNQTYRMQSHVDGTSVTCSLIRGTNVVLTDTDSTFGEGTVALRTNTAGASFRYVVVFTPAS